MDVGNVGLAVFMIFTLWFAAYSLATSKVTPEERDEMLDDEEMWP